MRNYSFLVPTNAHILLIYIYIYIYIYIFTVGNKKPTRCHLVLYLFLLYKLLYMFRATLCPSSGADDLVVFLPRVVLCRGCVGGQIRLAGCVSIGKYVAQRTSQWTHNQPTGSDRLHSHGTTLHAAKIPLSRQLLRMDTR